MLGRDRAHAAQRMLSRPWAADAELKEVVQQFVEKPHSVARLINNSETIKDLYSDFRKKSEEKVAISKNIRDLAWAPQRYSSESKVLARLVLTWDAVLGVLTSVPEIRGRTSVEGMACLETLRFLDTGTVLLLSMLADAALELHRVVHSNLGFTPSGSCFSLLLSWPSTAAFVFKFAKSCSCRIANGSS